MICALLGRASGGFSLNYPDPNIWLLSIPLNLSFLYCVLFSKLAYCYPLLDLNMRSYKDTARGTLTILETTTCIYIVKNQETPPSTIANPDLHNRATTLLGTLQIWTPVCAKVSRPVCASLQSFVPAHTTPTHKESHRIYLLQSTAHIRMLLTLRLSQLQHHSILFCLT